MRVKKPFGNIQEVANFFLYIKHPVFSRRLCYTLITEKSKLSKSCCNNLIVKRRTLRALQPGGTPNRLHCHETSIYDLEKIFKSYS